MSPLVVAPLIRSSVALRGALSSSSLARARKRANAPQRSAQPCARERTSVARSVQMTANLRADSDSSPPPMAAHLYLAKSPLRRNDVETRASFDPSARVRSSARLLVLGAQNLQRARQRERLQAAETGAKRRKANGERYAQREQLAKKANSAPVVRPSFSRSLFGSN